MLPVKRLSPTPLPTLLSTILDYLPSLAAFAVFGWLHSLFAQDGFKQWLARQTGPFFVEHFWRLVYCVLSFVALYHVIGTLHWDNNPDGNHWLINYPDWLWRCVLIVHLGSVAMIWLAFLQSDYLEFWGFKQAWLGVRTLAGRPVTKPPAPLFGTGRLVQTGLYRFVRHPMLAGGLLFLLTSGPSRNNIVFLCMYAAYMVIGAHYEERRLLRIFGEHYRRYREHVGAFVPRLSLRRVGQ